MTFFVLIDVPFQDAIFPFNRGAALSRLLDLARPGTMSSALTAADLHAVNDNAGDFNRLAFRQQRLRMKDSADLHVSASLKKLGVKSHNGLARAPLRCAGVCSA